MQKTPENTTSRLMYLGKKQEQTTNKQPTLITKITTNVILVCIMVLVIAASAALIRWLWNISS